MQADGRKSDEKDRVSGVKIHFQFEKVEGNFLSPILERAYSLHRTVWVVSFYFLLKVKEV